MFGVGPDPNMKAALNFLNHYIAQRAKIFDTVLRFNQNETSADPNVSPKNIK